MNQVTNYQQGGVPTTPEQVAEYWTKSAEHYAATERSGSPSISVKNMTLMAGDQPIPGNQFAAIILDVAMLNVFYTSAYNPNVVLPPICYAVGRNPAEMAPHPDMAKDPSYFKPQADRCGACPHKEWGSAQGTSQGRACRDRRRFKLLVAGTYAQGPQGWSLNANMDPTYYQTAAIMDMSIPPTSIKTWGAYVRSVSAQYGAPPFGVVTRVWSHPHPEHGKEAMSFEALGPIPEDWRGLMIQRHNEAATTILEGYEPPQAQQQRGGGFYGAQQQAIQGQR